MRYTQPAKIRIRVESSSSRGSQGRAILHTQLDLASPQKSKKIVDKAGRVSYRLSNFNQENDAIQV